MQAEIDQLRLENDLLRREVAGAVAANEQALHTWEMGSHGLNSSQITRYSRQVLLRSFGAQAQARLLKGCALIIGAGGLGSPAALYLAAAGVGRIGIVDQDVVELSNLHRQIIHNEARVGAHKAESAKQTCIELNSSIQIDVHKEALTPQNALSLIRQYDVVLDCTDNAPTRYLISDACVVSHKPLVSGAAIGTDGQLTVYNYSDDGPCYRCLFPVSPKAESCSSCSEAGVLGVIPGIIGSLQALEAIKILSGKGQVASRKLVIFDGLAMRFHAVKLRAKVTDCAACGKSPTITAQTLSGYSYSDFTGQAPHDSGPPELRVLPRDQRLSAEELADRLQENAPACTIIDVRPQNQYEMAHLNGSTNYPFDQIQQHLPHILERCIQQAASAQEKSDHKPCSTGDSARDTCKRSPSVFVVCRRGNDSQHVVKLLRDHGVASAQDLVGGLTAWSTQLDRSFPTY